MKFQTKTILTEGDVSGNLVSDVLNMQYNLGYAIQCILTDSPTGNILVQGSNDSTNWSTIDTLATSGTTTLAVNRADIMYPFIRVSKAAGGTGTLTVIATIKGA